MMFLPEGTFWPDPFSRIPADSPNGNVLCEVRAKLHLFFFLIYVFLCVLFENAMSSLFHVFLRAGRACA